jgi:hypothetical protein
MLQSLVVDSHQALAKHDRRILLFFDRHTPLNVECMTCDVWICVVNFVFEGDATTPKHCDSTTGKTQSLVETRPVKDMDIFILNGRTKTALTRNLEQGDKALPLELQLRSL